MQFRPSLESLEGRISLSVVIPVSTQSPIRRPDTMVLIGDPPPPPGAALINSLIPPYSDAIYAPYYAGGGPGANAPLVDS